jgi:hypothetical protein
VRDDSQVMAATVAGAVLGAIAGYMFFTPEGRALRRRLEPAIADLVRELDSFRGTFAKASSAANEGWRLLQETLAETGQPGSGAPGRYASPHQTSPF